LAESAPDAILTIDEESTILFANSAVERIFGYAPHELAGRALHTLIPERLRAAHDRGLARYLKSGRKNIPWTGIALPGLTKDGREIPVEISFGEFRDELGNRAFSGFVRDISDRVRGAKELEAARAEAVAALRELKRLSSVVDVALARGTYDAMLEVLLHRLREELDADEATVLLLDAQHGDLVVQASDYGTSEHRDDGKRVRIGEGVSGRVAESGKPIMIDDMTAVKVASARLRGLGSLIAAPIISEGKVIGVLHSGAKSRAHFKPEDVRLLEVVSDRMSGVLARTRLFEELRRLRDESERHAQEERALRKLAQSITGAVHVAEVMQQIVDGALSVSHATAAYVEHVASPDGEVEVVATTGTPVPKIGLRIPFPGSLTEEIIASGVPIFLVHLEGIGKAMAPYLGAICSACSALVVPIMAGSKPLGALVLLRGENEPPFSDNVVNRVRTLGELASLSLLRLVALEESERRRLEAEQALRSRDDVLSIVSHDLRNPVSTVSMSASLLRDADLDLTEAQRATQLEIISRSAHRMNRLIQDLLDVARIEGRRFNIACRCEDAAPLATEACESFGETARDKGLTLTCSTGRDLPRLMVDRDRVLQVLSNFLNNAIKFTPDGGIIRIDAERRDDVVRYSVRDTGPGIVADDLSRVFDRFWQSKSTAHMGTGLGLAIAKGIAEAHHGRVGVESTQGEGSTFWLELPISDKCG
jgi:PAS domain S-box-containing protein